jgi:hypothetical protein
VQVAERRKALELFHVVRSADLSAQPHQRSAAEPGAADVPSSKRRDAGKRSTRADAHDETVVLFGKIQRAPRNGGKLVLPFGRDAVDIAFDERRAEARDIDALDASIAERFQRFLKRLFVGLAVFLDALAVLDKRKLGGRSADVNASTSSRGLTAATTAGTMMIAAISSFTPLTPISVA